MLDKVTLKVHLSNPKTLIRRLQLYKVSKRDVALRYWDKKDGIYYAVSGNTFIIKNSIHKFYKGTNSNSFSLKENIEVIQNLSDRFKIDLFEAEIPKFEFGCNLLLPIDPKDYLLLMQSFKPKSCIPFDISNRGNTLKYITQSYSFKAYNKSMEAGDHSNHILRFEIERKSPSKCLRNLQNVKQILTLNGFKLLGEELLVKFDKIIFQDNIPYNTQKLSKPNELYLLFTNYFLGREKLLEILKRKYPYKTYQNELAKIKKVTEKYTPQKDIARTQLRRLLTEELAFLINH